VSPSRRKAINTRLKRLTATFEAEHGREPSIEELNLLYREELSAAQKKSRQNYKGDGGLRAMTPERRKEISKLGNQKRWGHENKKDENIKAEG
jgi:hypothetical protein